MPGAYRTYRKNLALTRQSHVTLNAQLANASFVKQNESSASPSVSELLRKGVGLKSHYPFFYMDLTTPMLELGRDN